MADKLAPLLEILSLEGKGSIASHVTAEPKVVPSLVKKLAADVST